jgi:predicted acylesterase/phospholipase RssA
MKSSKYNNILFHPDHMTKVPDGQRILVLQGGGSLGAYEAGAYQAIYENILICL